MVIPAPLVHQYSLQCVATLHNIMVQQHGVRESQWRVDPSGSVTRRLRVINRWQYHVNGPGALWHTDSSHKLIRYVLLEKCMLLGRRLLHNAHGSDTYIGI